MLLLFKWHLNGHRITNGSLYYHLVFLLYHCIFFSLIHSTLQLLHIVLFLLLLLISGSPFGNVSYTLFPHAVPRTIQMTECLPYPQLHTLSYKGDSINKGTRMNVHSQQLAMLRKISVPFAVSLLLFPTQHTASINHGRRYKLCKQKGYTRKRRVSTHNIPKVQCTQCQFVAVTEGRQRYWWSIMQFTWTLIYRRHFIRFSAMKC